MREENAVLNNGTRADIVHYSFAGNPTIIELKRLSMLQDDNNILSLALKINDDIAKTALINRNTGLNTPWYVIGIGLDSGSTGGGVDHAKQFNFGQATYWTQANQDSPTIFWCRY